MVVFGLDFGTTFSTLSVLKNNEVFLLRQQDSSYIPTYVFSFEESREVAYGYDAETYNLKSNIKGSFFRDLKRWVGCNEDNFARYYNKLQPSYSVNLTSFGQSLKQTVKLKAFNKQGAYTYALPDLIASFVRCIIKDGEDVFKTPCSGVVCSVPAAYNSVQRSFMMECVTLSGYNCLHIINEPSSAAFSASSSLSADDTFCLVYDFGGGTFDVSGVSVRNNTFVVRSSGGDMNLGARDVDRTLVEMVYGRTSSHEVDYTLDVSSLKEKLSTLATPIEYPVPVKDSFEYIMVSPEDLSRVIAPFIQRTVKITTEVYQKFLRAVEPTKRVGEKMSSESKCVLVAVGGSSYLPVLSNILTSIPYVKRVIELHDARAAVSIGCAMYSLCLSENSPMLLVDCAAHNLSIPDYKLESIALVPAGAPIPFSGRRTISLQNAAATSTYKASLFEGDRIKCMQNELVYSSTITLSDIGVTSQVAT
ncbi:HSP70, partial [Carnation necrotic fleck virus]